MHGFWKNTFSKIRIQNNDLRDTRTYILYICIISVWNLNKDLPSPSVWKQAYNIEIVKECWYSRFHHHLISIKLNIHMYMYIYKSAHWWYAEPTNLYCMKSYKYWKNPWQKSVDGINLKLLCSFPKMLFIFLNLRMTTLFCTWFCGYYLH